MTNEEREKKIRKQPIPTKEECLAFYNELVKFADVRFVPYYNMAIETLEQAPKTGHWIYEKRKRLINETDEGAKYITDYWCKCSKCGGDFGYIKMKDAFCKYCGAKMESEETNETDN